jgi:hypothetical protein
VFLRTVADEQVVLWEGKETGGGRGEEGKYTVKECHGVRRWRCATNNNIGFFAKASSTWLVRPCLLACLLPPSLLYCYLQLVSGVSQASDRLLTGLS